MNPYGILGFLLLLPISGNWAFNDFDADSGYLYVDEEIIPNSVQDVRPYSSNQNIEIRPRWKRETSADIDTEFKFGDVYMRRLRKLYMETKNLPPRIKYAIGSGDYSNVTAEDVREVNVTLLEYIPSKALAKMNSTVIDTVVNVFLNFNRPHALGRLLEVTGDKVSTASLINRLGNQRLQSAATPQSTPNEAGGVLLYSALNRLGDTGGLTENRINQLKQFDLLKYVPEEQLMKVKDSNVAKNLLETLYGVHTSTLPEQNEPDDKALVYKLLETQHGPPQNWSAETIRTVASKYLKFIPAAALKEFSPDKVYHTVLNLRDEVKFDNPLQAKTVTDLYLEKEEITRDAEGNLQGNTNNLGNIFGALEKLAAFVNPAITNNPGHLNTIISQCDKWNLPAPLQAVTKYLKAHFKGKNVNALGANDLLSLSPEVLKNSPPEVIGRAMETNALDENKISEIGKFGNSTKREGLYGNTFFKGLVAQLSGYVVTRLKAYANTNKYHMERIPSAFVGGIGIKGIQEMDSHHMVTLLQKVRENPSALDDEQKALLLRRLRDENMLDGNGIPPEISFLRPRVKGTDIHVDDLDGLPSDNELRLAHGQGKPIMPGALERDPTLVGTMTPKQVDSIDVQFIPGILAAVRRSKDGPQPQTVKALSKRLAEYIRLKADDPDSEDKKLLKHITAAEVSKLPASVLAYFVDRKQTAKLPPSVRKELLIALGEMSTKDRTMIPERTREEIILQGLDALDSLTGHGQPTYDVPELAIIGHSVSDLSPKAIQRLTPVAFEQALDMVQGTTEEDNGLKQRACLTQAQRKAWRDKILEAYGRPKLWDPATVTTLCCALPLLDESDLMTIDKESLVICSCISDAPPPAHLAELKTSLDRACDKQHGRHDDTKKNFERVRAERAMDLNDLESQIITRKKRAHSHGKHKKGLTCTALRLGRSAKEFDAETLMTLKAKEMKNCLYELGSVKLGDEEEKILWKKLVEAHGGRVQNISSDELRNAGYILKGIELGQINDLNFADHDVVAAFGRPLGFSTPILRKMADRVEMVRTRAEYQAADLIILRNMLCEFELKTVKSLVPEAFSLSLPILRSLEPTCELSHLKALANIATHEKVFGDPANWTAADVRGIGILLKGLSIASIKKIPAEAFLGVSPSVAEALTEETLQSLSPDQVSFIPIFSAQAMSEDQLNTLSSLSKDALDLTLRGPSITDAALTTFNPPFATTIAVAVAVATVVTATLF